MFKSSRILDTEMLPKNLHVNSLDTIDSTSPNLDDLMLQLYKEPRQKFHYGDRLQWKPGLYLGTSGLFLYETFIAIKHIPKKTVILNIGRGYQCEDLDLIVAVMSDGNLLQFIVNANRCKLVNSDENKIVIDTKKFIPSFEIPDSLVETDFY